MGFLASLNEERQLATSTFILVSWRNTIGVQILVWRAIDRGSALARTGGPKLLVGRRSLRFALYTKISGWLTNKSPFGVRSNAQFNSLIHLTTYLDHAPTHSRKGRQQDGATMTNVQCRSGASTYGRR